MPIDRDRGILFVHIPKTGGTSITKFLKLNELAGSFTADVILSAAKYRVPMWKQHLSMPQVRKLYFESEFIFPKKEDVTPAAIKKFDEFYKFTFVRNPWDRLVSNFLYFKEKELIPSEFNLRNFFTYVVDTMANLVSRGAPKEFDANNRLEGLMVIHCNPQTYYLSKVDPLHVFKFENLIPEMQLLCDRLQIHFDKDSFPHEKNSNNKDHYTSFYGDDLDLIAAVEQLYENDVKSFGYKFGE